MLFFYIKLKAALRQTKKRFQKTGVVGAKNKFCVSEGREKETMSDPDDFLAKNCMDYHTT